MGKTENNIGTSNQVKRKWLIRPGLVSLLLTVLAPFLLVSLSGDRSSFNLPLHAVVVTILLLLSGLSMAIIALVRRVNKDDFRIAGVTLFSQLAAFSFVFLVSLKDGEGFMRAFSSVWALIFIIPVVYLFLLFAGLIKEIWLSGHH